MLCGILYTQLLRLKRNDMNFELKIIPDTRIAFFCWSGPITLEDREENRHCVMQLCQEDSIDQLIIDTRQEISETRTMQMFDFARSSSTVRKRQLSSKGSISKICPPADHNAHPHATATFTIVPRMRKTTSLVRRRFTTTFYGTSSRRQPHSGQPAENSPRRS